MEQNSSPQPQQATPPAASPATADSPSVLGFLDAHKSEITGVVVAAATYFFPPAKLLLQADPQLSMLAVSGLFAALHAVPKLARLIRK